MLIHLSYLIVGLGLLVWSADKFTDGASAIAQNFGVSRLIIGLTIVAIGSSSPEIFVSLLDSLKTCEPNQPNCGPEIAIGNALGSNITNIALVLGVTALICPLVVESGTLKREIPVMFAVVALALACLWDLKLSHTEGAILLFALLAYFVWLVRLGLTSRSKGDPMLEELADEIPDEMPNHVAIFYLIVGLALLVVSSHALIKGASGIAAYFGVSETIIGLTIVALGTSLPELAASVAGVLKNEHDIAIGNIIGSNIFNLLAVLGIPAIIAAPSIAPEILAIDYPVMIGLTVAMSIMAYGFRGPGRINRIEGGILVAVFIGYYVVRFF